jgi:hypothetical protein
MPMPYAVPPPVPAAPRTRAGAVRFEPVEGTGFAVAYLPIAPTPSGPSIGSLVAGIAAILVSFVVACFGLVGASQGWGLGVSGAFVVLGLFVGLGAIGLGVFGLRQVRHAEGSVTGRGMAIAGLSCGGTGVGLTLLAFVLAAVAATSPAA